jgi:hypothetical protein
MAKRDPLDDLGPPTGRALLAVANPFVARDGAVPPVFGGREEVLAAGRVDLEHLRAGRPAARRTLEGLRGVGKTALMARVRRAAEGVDLATIHLEADPREDPTGIARVEVTSALNRLLGTAGRAGRRLAGLRALSIGPGGVEVTWDGPAGDSLVEALILDAARVAADRERGLFVTLDEAHEAESSLLKPVLRALHRADQDGLPAGGWIAGLPGTVTRLIMQGQTYTERIVVYDIGLLDREGVAEAIRGPFAEHAGAKVSEAVIDRVFRESGGYPFLVQAWGEALWAAARSPRQIDATDAARAAASARARADALMRARWNRLPRRARRYALAMAALGEQGPYRTADVAGRLGGSQQAASPARDELLGSGAAAASGYGLVDFTVPGFATWLRRLQPAP